MVVLLRYLLLFLLCPSITFAQYKSITESDDISIVGSTTVYPFIGKIAEEFGKKSKFRTPVVEAVGSGTGFKMFCAGVGKNFPDIATSSRKITLTELELCKKNQVLETIELLIGYDGIVIANADVENATNFDLTKAQLFDALSEYSEQSSTCGNNCGYDSSYSRPLQFWSEIDSRFPNIGIEIYGPNQYSGTYDMIRQNVMLDTCMIRAHFIEKFPDKNKRRIECTKIRNDGKYIASGNENAIIQKLKTNKNAIGIVGYGFLKKNTGVVKGNRIAGILPNPDEIKSGRYPLVRPLYIYVKKEHITKDITPGLKEFIAEIADTKAIGSNGYLYNDGFIPLPDSDIKKLQMQIT